MHRPHPTRRRSIVALVLAAALAVTASGCADDGDDGPASGSDRAGATTTEARAGGDPAEGDGSGGDDGSPGEPAGDPRPSSGCGASDATAEVEAERTLEVGGVERRFLLTVPEEHDGEEPLPVVLDFHGLMEGAEVHARMSGYSALAEQEGFVAVFPHGTGDPLHWNTDPDPANPDLAYVDAVVDRLGSELCVDESRIYATGLSNGAMFTSLLICARADLVAAAAPVAGITYREPCEPSRPVPIVTYHGTDDPILLFNGGFDLSAIPGGDEAAPADGATTTTRPAADLDGEGYPAAVAAFAEANGCEDEPTDTEPTDEIVHRVYDCPEGADVEFFVVLGGGHSWPSSEFSQTIGDIVGATTTDVDATADAWAFLSRFRAP